jgi:hypothetical protein
MKQGARNAVRILPDLRALCPVLQLLAFLQLVALMFRLPAPGSTCPGVEVSFEEGKDKAS